MSAAPRISVCVPLYNAERTIARTLDSVLAARERIPGTVEIVVVDDNSSDSSVGRVEPYTRHAGVRLERNPQNLGLTGNWQRALSLGAGEIVTLLHADDWYAPECLDVVDRAFAAEPSLVMLAAGQTFHRPDGTEVPFTQHRSGSFTGAEYADWQLQFEECPAPSTAFFRRAVLAALGTFYDPSYRWCPELDLYIRLALANPAGTFRHEPRVLIHRSSDPAQFSARYPGWVAIDACTAVVRHAAVLSPGKARAASRRGARRTIFNGIAAALVLRDWRQAGRVVGSAPFRRWALRDPLG